MRIAGFGVIVLVASAHAQTVDCLSPTEGIDLGGTLVTVTGAELDQVTGVTIGGVAVDNLEILDPSKMIFNAPAANAGTADVVISSAGDTLTFDNAFEYVACRTAQGSALQFDGIDDVIIFGAVTPLTAHTIEAWVKPDSVAVSQVIVGHLNSPGAVCAFGFALWVFNDGTLGYAVDQSAACGFANSTSGPAVAGVWTHMAGAYDGNEYRLYLNGVLVGSGTGGLASSGWMTAGGAQFVNGFQGLYGGALDELRVWNHARAVQQVRDGMHRSLTGAEPGLMGYWRIDEGDGQLVGDRSPSGTTGVLGLGGSAESSDPTWVASDAPVCLPADPCAADTNDSGDVDVVDLLAVLSAWGDSCGVEDINDDITVDILDLLLLLAQWGDCVSRSVAASGRTLALVRPRRTSPAGLTVHLLPVE